MFIYLLAGELAVSSNADKRAWTDASTRALKSRLTLALETNWRGSELGEMQTCFQLRVDTRLSLEHPLG
jgi:hypothetical protein